MTKRTKVRVKSGYSYISAALGELESGSITNAVQLGGTGDNGKLSLEVRHCADLLYWKVVFGSDWDCLLEVIEWLNEVAELISS